MNIEKRLKEIRDRKAEIRQLLEADGEVNIDELETELRSLNAEAEKLEQRRSVEQLLNDGSASGSPIATPAPIVRRISEEDEQRLYRSAWVKTLQGKPLDDAEKRAYSTASTSAGAAIPTNVANDILRKMYEVSPIIQRCRVLHVPGNFTYPVEGTTEDAALHAENAAITPAGDTIVGVKLTGYEITKLISVSRAASAMTVAAFESFLTDIIGESIARKIENYIFTGTGSNQPGGVKTAGKGASGAYTDGTDQVTVAAASSLTETNVVDLYSMLGSGYERNAVWCMRKATFFTSFYPLMNKSKNNLIEFANGRYYVMGNEVYFTASVPANEAYLGDFGYIIGNYSQDITVTSSDVSGLRYNSIDYLAACVFDSQPAAGLGAFVHLAKASA